MAKERREHDLGIRLRPSDPAVNPLSKDGDILVDSTESDRIKVRQDGVDREVTTNDDTQTLENKTIDGTDATGNNTVLTDADDVSYDNTSSGLVATDAQAAIDELKSNADNLTASDIPFDNTSNGYTSTNVQDAIEEAGTMGSGGGPGSGDAIDVDYDNTLSGLTATNVQAAIDEIVTELGGSIQTDSVEVVSGNSVVMPNLTFTFGATNHKFFRNGVLMNKVLSFSTVNSPAVENFAQEYIEVDNGGASTTITLHPNFEADDDLFEMLIFAGLNNLGDSANIDYDNTGSGLTSTNVQGAIDELDTNVDANTSSISNHVSASSDVHGIGASSSVVGTETTQTLTNKTLTSPDINGGTIDGSVIATSKVGGGTASNSNKVLATADTKANLDSLTREAGSLYFATDELKLYFDDGVQLVDLSGGGMTFQSGVNLFFSNNIGGTQTFTYTVPNNSIFRGRVYLDRSSNQGANTPDKSDFQILDDLPAGTDIVIEVVGTGSPQYQVSIDSVAQIGTATSRFPIFNSGVVTGEPNNIILIGTVLG